MIRRKHDPLPNPSPYPEIRAAQHFVLLGLPFNPYRHGTPEHDVYNETFATLANLKTPAFPNDEATPPVRDGTFYPP